MAIGINTPAVAVSASTGSAQGTLPSGTGSYIRATNSSTAGAYVNAGANPTATNANIMLAPYESRTFARDPNVDVKVATLLTTGTGIVSFAVVGEAGDS